MPTRQEAVDKIITLGQELAPIVEAQAGDRWVYNTSSKLTEMNETFGELEHMGVPYAKIEAARGKMNGVTNALDRRGTWPQLSSKVNALNKAIADDIRGLAQSGGRRKTKRSKKTKKSKKTRSGRKSKSL
jgi:hypothetical protein